MKKYFYMAVAAIAALSSCSNDNEFEPSQIGKQALVFTATMEGSEGTRATYDSDNKCASWEEGDQISINGKTYNAQSAGLTTTFKAATEGEAEGPTYNAYFACTYDGTTATLPAEISETWANGKFNMPMYATSNTTSLAFKNLCGVLKITVKSDQIAAVKKIKVSSANKAISGAFTITSDAAELTSPSTIANALTVTYTDAVTTTEEGKVFYVAVPAQTYKNLSIAVSDGSTTMVMTTKANQDITVARNTVYPINFNGTTGTAKATIGGSQVVVNWVQLWDGGPKFADRNVGASSVTEIGTTMKFTEATKTGANYVWGANWCTPSQDQMDELLKAATSDGSEKVKCEIVREGNVETGIIIGFKFTGKKTGYTGNSVFFPGLYQYSVRGSAYYWSGTANGSSAWCMRLSDEGGDWESNWSSEGQYSDWLVRPVLK